MVRERSLVTRPFYGTKSAAGSIIERSDAKSSFKRRPIEATRDLKKRSCRATVRFRAGPAARRGSERLLRGTQVRRC